MSNENKFGWYELMTTDVKAAIPFYEAVVGWKTQPWDGPGDYTLWTAGGTGIGGAMVLPDDAKKMGAPPHWLAYVSVASVDAVTAKATGLGAKVYMAPRDLPGNAGRIAVLADPQGAVFAVHQAPEKMAMPDWKPVAPPTPGAISWHELYANDCEAALQFYGALFGWKEKDRMEMPGMGPYVMFEKDGAMLGGMMNKPPSMPAPPHWGLYAYVTDLDASLATCQARGGKLLNGPMPIPGGDRVANCMDPQGAAFSLHGK